MFRKTPKLVIFTLLALIIIGVLIWTQTQFDSFGEKFTVSMLGTAVTVLIIDQLLGRQRDKRLKRINNNKSKEINTFLQINLLKIMDSFDFLQTPEERSVLDIPNKERIKSHIQDFLNSDSLDNWFENVNFDDGGNSKMSDIKERFIKVYDYLEDNLKRIEPYPDPSLIESVKDRRAELDGSFQAAEKIAEILQKINNEDLEEVVGTNTLDRQEKLDIIYETMFMGSDEDNTGFLKKTIKDNCEFIISVIDRASDNDLEYILE